MSPIDTLLAALKFRRPTECGDVLGPQAFQEVLAVERARSDRSGWPFTLVVIALPHSKPDDRSVEVLFEVLKERTRRIDFRGWHNGNLALILPYTHSEHANDLLNSIEQHYAKRIRMDAAAIGARPEIEFTVYCYPPSLDRKMKSV
jgi:hypothetical protein